MDDVLAAHMNIHRPAYGQAQFVAQPHAAVRVVQRPPTLLPDGVGVGALGGWLASVAGLVDLLFVAQVRRLITAWGHVLMAVMMLSLATFNWQLRVGDDPARYLMPWGLGMTLATAGFISLAAYLGGRLVYENAVGVKTD